MSVSNHKSKYGWMPDLPDSRDFSYAASRSTFKTLPAKKDLTKHCPPIYNQGHIGSCTANAIGAAIHFEMLKSSPDAAFMPSRLFIYYNERVIEHTVSVDNGAQLKTGIKSVNKQGVCNEDLWPYVEQKFTKKPLATCYKQALNHQVISYHRVPRNINQMKSCLAEGYPFVFGFTVYESFESDTVAKTGKLSLPTKDEAQKGGHAVMAVGYDDAAKRFIIRNSWGTTWGKKGYFTMPYDYLMDSNLSDDFWTIRMLEQPSSISTKSAKKKK